MQIEFLGATREVTGSKFLITTKGGRRILLDCGIFQGKGLDTWSTILYPLASSWRVNTETTCAASWAEALLESTAIEPLGRTAWAVPDIKPLSR